MLSSARNYSVVVWIKGVMGQDIKSYLDGQAIHELEEKMYALLQQG